MWFYYIPVAALVKRRNSIQDYGLTSEMGGVFWWVVQSLIRSEGGATVRSCSRKGGKRTLSEKKILSRILKGSSASGRILLEEP